MLLLNCHFPSILVGQEYRLNMSLPSRHFWVDDKFPFQRWNMLVAFYTFHFSHVSSSFTNSLAHLTLGLQHLPQSFYIYLKPFDDPLVVIGIWAVFHSSFLCFLFFLCIFLKDDDPPKQPGKTGFQKITCTQAATFSLTRAPVSLVVFQIPRLWPVGPENLALWRIFGDLFFESKNVVSLLFCFLWCVKCKVNCPKLGGGFEYLIICCPYLAGRSNLTLTNMFSTGWLNYQLKQLEIIFTRNTLHSDMFWTSQ